MALEIKLLDVLQIKQDGQSSAVLNSPKGLALLLYVLIAQKPVKREILADLLWDSISTAQSLRNLRALLFRLRKLVPQIQSEGDRIAFAAGPEDHIDLFILTRYLHSANPQELDAALQVYRHDLLQEFYLPDSPDFNEWLTIEREHLRRRVLDAYERLSKMYEEKGQWRAGVGISRRWLELDPYDDEATYYYIAFLAAIGQVRLAQGQYHRYRQLIAEQFDLEPTPKMKSLFERIRVTDRNGRELDRTVTDYPIQPALAPDWGEAPGAVAFWGRENELVQLESWLVREHCPAVIILGIGGQGKTTLAAQAARSLADHFDGVIWRSLLNAPLPKEIIRDLLTYFSQGQGSELPESIDVQLAVLGEHLKRKRYLVILDNLESVFLDEAAGIYRDEYGDYGRLLQVFSHSRHQSGLLITSREFPQGLERLEQKGSGAHSLQLEGLPVVVGSEMLQSAGVSGSTADMAHLVERYSGNPLALRLVAKTVQDLYDGNIAAFLQDETAIFEDIRTVLDAQFERLSFLEQEVLIWLAIEREPVSLASLQSRLLHPTRQRRLIEAIYGLQRRSLVEKLPQGFGLQNVIIEYLTDRLVERVSAEIRHGRVHYLSHFALQPADSRAYVNLSQERRILKPIGDMLTAASGSCTIAGQIQQMLETLRPLPRDQQGYAGGNVLNLVLHLGLEPARFDFSGLNVWQVNLQGVDLPGVNLTDTDLTGSVFTDLFGFVYAVSFSPNGQLLAAGSGDGRIQTWWVASGQPALTIQVHAESVWGLAFSPDGRALASCSADGSVRLWNATSGTPEQILQGHPDGVLAVAFDPTGDLLVSAGAAGQVHVWDVQSGKLRRVLQEHTANVQTVAFSPDGRWLATAGRDRHIHLWMVAALADADTAAPQHILSGHTNWVNALAFSPDGRTLASASEDMTICLWEPESGALRQTIRGHTAGIHALAFSPDGKYLSSGGNDHSIRVWEGASGQIRHTFWGHTNWVYSLAFNPLTKILASGSWDQSVRLWDVRKHHALQTFHGHMRWAFGLAFSPDGRTLASASAEKKVRLWRVANGQVCATLNGHTDWVWNVAFAPGSALLASISMDHSVRLWDSETGTLLTVLQEHQDGLQSVAISPDGSVLAAGGLDHLIVLWDIRDASHGRPTRVLHKLSAHSGWCLGLDFSPDGRTLASAGADHTIRLWDVHSGVCLRVLQGHSDGVQQVFFSPDGTRLASAGWDKTAVLWDVASGEIIHRFEGHAGILRALAFSPDGNLLATGGNDLTIRVWDAVNGTLQQAICAHENWIFDLAFHPNGRLLASAGADESIKLWDVRAGKLHQRWQIPGPYEGLNLHAARGLSAAQVSNLEALGASVGTSG